MGRCVIAGGLLASALACGTLLDVDGDPVEGARDSGAADRERDSASAEGGQRDADVTLGDGAAGDGGPDVITPVQRPIAFVTTATSVANFGGVSGADTICASAAAAAGLPGAYRAYLNQNAFTAESRLVDAGTFYRVDGQPIFDAFPPISAKLPFLTAQGQALASGAQAWTGLETETCSDWSNVSDSCGYGDPNAGGTGWRRTGSQSGTAQLHVYCFGN